MPPLQENAYNLVIYPSKVTKVKSLKLPENFVKIAQTCRQLGANLSAKLQILIVLGTVFTHFYPYKWEVWHGGADLQSAPPCQISHLSGQCVNAFLDL